MERKCSRAALSFFTLMPNSLSSITTISSASMESSPRPPAKSGSSSAMSSGGMSSNFSRSISSSFSLRRRSVVIASLSHRCRSRQPLPLDPRRDVPEAPLQRHQREENRQLEAAARRPPDVAGEHAHDRFDQTEARMRTEKELQKRPRVELRDEAKVARDGLAERALVR